ncbi:hypothetical protein P8C59_003102 [Phyllachora maydis]|uniref:Uncharacterized protein n=1 Tax=Phyllachora maydis TaxID=1825666 RepID=A0AAD9I159_9PEZI|nr:hypothetical protein P8C59_003102 [Phyllachora maydis]
MLIRSVSYKRIKGIAALILSIYIGIAAYAPIGYIAISNLLITTITTSTANTTIATTTAIVVAATATSTDRREKENRWYIVEEPAYL